MKILNNFYKGEEGSAIIEFVALGLPLFLPLFIFLSNISQISSDQRIVQSMARQLARAYVTAPDEVSARARLGVIKDLYLKKYFDNLKSSNSESRLIDFSINCSANPCLILNSSITATAALTSKDGVHRYTAIATEIVDSWRNSP